jgi:DNA segregation ATPase FtsK/SpoIIIE-like protein
MDALSLEKSQYLDRGLGQGRDKLRGQMHISPFLFLLSASLVLFAMASLVSPNTMGQLGQKESGQLILFFGCSVFPFLIGVFSSSIFFFRSGNNKSIRKGVSMMVAFFAMAILLEAMNFNVGLFGEVLNQYILPYLGQGGAVLLSIVLLLLSLTLFKKSFCWAGWACNILSLLCSFVFNRYFSKQFIFHPTKVIRSEAVLENKTPNFRTSDFSHPIEEALSEFGFSAQLVQEKRGPVVTQFHLSLGPGIKSSSIKAIEHDIAREIAANAVRVNRVPGKPYISIEVPNSQREMVCSEDLFKEAPQERFPLMLGVNALGEREVISLENHPHLLVGGATGAGKTVLLQNLILSLINFSEAKIVLVDPKRLDLNIFDKSQSLAAPIASDPEQADHIINRLVVEMENRYKKMQEQGAKTCEDINVPRIAVFVDELADIVDYGSIESNLIRISAKARACGIHLILCTQRPCAKTFSAKLKSNINTRIALTTATAYDSRIILGENEGGAEQLVGQGDMLCLKDGKIERLHCGYLNDAYVSSQIQKTTPEYLPVFNESNVSNFPSRDEDILYQKALKLLEDHSELSISKIQRQLKVGYNKAASIEERLIENGMLGDPIGGNRGRAVLV